MNTSSFHLNLLKQTEHVSSSPIRLRVIAPMLAFFTIIGTIVWWGILFGQLMNVKSTTESIAENNRQNSTAEVSAKKIQDEFNEKNSQLLQLKGYENGLRRLGPALMNLAEEFPMDIQLIELSISPLPPQNLKQKNPKLPPLRGPTETSEKQTFSLIGRTKNTDLIQRDLISILKKETLDALSSGKAPSKLDCRPESTDGPSSDRQNTPTSAPFMKFTLDYAMPERIFVAPQERTKK